MVGFKAKEDVGQILESLGTDDYEKNIVWVILKAFLFERVIGIVIQYNYLRNQVSLFSNSTQSLTPVRECVRVLPMPYQCYGVMMIVF